MLSPGPPARHQIADDVGLFTILSANKGINITHGGIIVVQRESKICTVHIE